MNTTRIIRQRENFWVKHYAGKVKYTVEGWVERNMDRIPESFSSTLAASTHKVTTTTDGSLLLMNQGIFLTPCGK